MILSLNSWATWLEVELENMTSRGGDTYFKPIHEKHKEQSLDSWYPVIACLFFHNRLPCWATQHSCTDLNSASELVDTAVPWTFLIVISCCRAATFYASKRGSSLPLPTGEFPL